MLRLLTLLILPGLAVVATLWALDHSPSLDLPATAWAEEIPENSYMRVRHRLRDPNGELLYEVAAQQLDQHLHRAALLLDRPRIRWLDPAWRNSQAQARHGEILKRQVALRGDVEFLLETPQQEPALIQGQSLTLDAEQERVYSEETVAISRGTAVMHGKGLEYWLDGSGGNLRENVQVRRFPAAQQPLTRTLLRQILSGAISTAHARENDALDLTADRMEWDARRKVSVYYGNVRALQGDMVLTSDQLTVRAKDDRVEVLHAEGNARWNQTLTSGRPLQARAHSILYRVRERKAILDGAVNLQSGEGHFTGNRVTYLLDEERIETPQAQHADERVRLRLNTSDEDTP